MSLRDQLLQCGAVPTELLTINANGAPLTVEIRGLSVDARAAVLSAAVVVVGQNDDGSPKTDTDIAKLQASILVECTFDPATGQKVFAEEDVAAIRAMSGEFVDQIFTVGKRLAALDTKTADALEKNSGATQNGTSGSGSPAN